MKHSIVLAVAICFLSIGHAQSWSLTGNAGTNPSTNFIGTTDANPLSFRIYNEFAGKLDGSLRQTFFGWHAGLGTTASDNTAIGYSALSLNTNGYQNTALGSYAMNSNTTGYNNIALGANALTFNNTGYQNTAIGVSALYKNTTGWYNIAVGNSALSTNTVGYQNTAIGISSLSSNTSGYYNIGLGWSTLSSNTYGQSNIAIGASTLSSNVTGSSNTGVGAFALNFNTSGYDNTAVGMHSSANTTGIENSSFGAMSMYYTDGASSSYNTSIGAFTLYGTKNSQYNTALGFIAGGHYNNGYNNVFLGANTDVSAAGFYNVIAIGQATVCTAPSQVTIGNGATSSYRAYANWTNISDGRFKKNVKENVPGLDFIIKLRPVSYNLDATGLDAFLHRNIKDSTSVESKAVQNKALKEKEQDIQMGFIAQEVEKTAKDMHLSISAVEAPKNENDVYGIRYSELVVPLVKAIQEQQEMINSLKKDIAALKDQADLTVLLRETLSSEKISTYPNPVANDMTVSITTQNEGSGSLQIFDAGGKLVKQMNVTIRKGVNTTNLSLPVMAAGVYTIKVTWGKDLHKQVSFVKGN